MFTLMGAFGSSRYIGIVKLHLTALRFLSLYKNTGNVKNEQAIQKHNRTCSILFGTLYLVIPAYPSTSEVGISAKTLKNFK